MTLISLSFSGLADEKAVDEILVLRGIDNPAAVQFDSWIFLTLVICRMENAIGFRFHVD